MTNEQDFWQQVSERLKENQQITQGGLPPYSARLAERIGLHFWFFTLWLSLGITFWLWLLHRPTLLSIVRFLVWR